MAKKKKKTKKVSTEAPSNTASTSLGGLLAGLGFSASEPAEVAPVVESAAGELELSRQGRLVLRMERKGRGGKTVTVLSGLVGTTDQVDGVARTLKKALGTGARVEGGEVVIQGDVRERLRAWLAERGVKRISC